MIEKNLWERLGDQIILLYWACGDWSSLFPSVTQKLAAFLLLLLLLLLLSLLLFFGKKISHG
jgi:hypothetical protein